MGNIFKVSPDGVDAIHTCSSTLQQSLETMLEEARELRSALTQYQEGAGPHYDQIEEMAEQLSGEAQGIEESVQDVCKRLEDLARTYEEIISAGL